MPLSKERMRRRKKLERERKKVQRFLRVKSILTSADIRAMKAAGLSPEDIENETGKVASYLYYALLRDRDAVKAHLSWLQSDLKKGRIILNEQYGEPEGTRETVKVGVS